MVEIDIFLTWYNYVFYLTDYWAKAKVGNLRPFKIESVTVC